MNETKSILTSKTFWFGVGQVIFGVIGYFTGWIDPTMASGLIFTGLSTIGLRVKTTTPVSL